MNETLKFLTPDRALEIRAAHGSPVYVYDEATLRAQAAATLAFPNAFGLTVRYAMKAAPNAAILKLFTELGLHLDASSGYEVERALRAGIPMANISLSSQELPGNLAELLDKGLHVNATSLNQISRIGAVAPGRKIGLRFNPGLGSGGTARTNVGGPASSFGIWYAYREDAQALCAQFDLSVDRIHSHIGSGSDPAVWQRVVSLNLDLVRAFPDVTTLDLGGGFKTGRMADEVSTDLQAIGAPVKAEFEAFAKETGRELRLEIEPGTFLVANAACILATVQDKVDTGDEGYRFLRLDCGMTEVLRPSLYGAQQPIVVIPADGAERPSVDYIVAGHCCESGDILTPAPGDAEALAPRSLSTAEIGDAIAIEGTGAYCSGMSAKNYNSFPEAAEVLLHTDGTHRLIRSRQSLDQMLENEL